MIPRVITGFDPPIDWGVVWFVSHGAGIRLGWVEIRERHRIEQYLTLERMCSKLASIAVAVQL
jgi:hypothetical protein